MATVLASDSSGNGTTTLMESDPVPAIATDPSSPAPVPAPTAVEKRWPGWPGDSVFRLIVPVLKVGSIIGRKGELIKKMCEETRARIRILDGALGTPDRIVLISAKEEPDAEISPAMEAVLRVFKRVSGITEGEIDNGSSATGGAVCSVRLLVASSQGISLIGKQGTQIRSIQESTDASVRVLSGDVVPLYASSDERIVEIQGEYLKVLKALEATVGHLRKFLVDRSVIPLFEKTYIAPISHDRAVDTWADKTQSLIHTASQTGIGSDFSRISNDYPRISNDYPLSSKRDSLFLDRGTQLDPHIPHSGVSLYGQDPAIGRLRSSGLGRDPAALITQMTQTMQIPLTYAEDIIGVGGANIAYIRRTSGAILTVQESKGLPDEITVEIKGTSTQVHTAQQLIQDFIAGHKDPIPIGHRDPISSSYGNLDTGLRSYSHLSNTPYPSSSSLMTQSLGGYGSSGVPGYDSYML